MVTFSYGGQLITIRCSYLLSDIVCVLADNFKVDCPYS